MSPTRTPAPPGSVREEGERSLFATQLRSELRDKRAITRINQGMSAKSQKVFHTKETGVVLSEPMIDWKERREYVRLYLEASGQLAQKIDATIAPLTINLVAPRGKSSEVKIHREES